MQPKDVLQKIQHTFSPTISINIISSIRHDDLVWKQFLSGNFCEDFFAYAENDLAYWNPSSIALFALNINLSAAELAQEPLIALDSEIQLKADRIFELTRSKGRAPERLEDAAWIALSLRDYRRRYGSWKGLAQLLQIGVEAHAQDSAIWNSALACLFNIIPDQEEFLSKLISENSTKNVAVWASHIFLTQVLDFQAKADLFLDLISRFSLSEQVFWLEYLQRIGEDELSTGLGNILLSSLPAEDQQFKCNPEEMTPQALMDEISKLQKIASLQAVVGNHSSAENILEEAQRYLDYLSQGLNIQRIASIAHQEDKNIPQNVLIDIPDSEKLKQELAVAILEAPDHFELLEQLTESGENPWIAIKKADHYEQVGHHDQALTVASRAVEQIINQPEQERVHANFGFVNNVTKLQSLKILHNLGLYEEAVSIGKALLIERPLDLEVISELRKIHEGLRDDYQAVEYAQIETMFNPEDIDSHRRLEKLYENCEYWPDAFEEAEKILELSEYPKSSDLLALARCAVEIRDFEKAIEVCNLLLEENENCGEANLLMGKAHIALENTNEAIRYLSSATILIPENSDAWMMLSDAYQATNQSKHALETLQTAILTIPESADVNFALGEAYREKGSISEALPYLRKASNLNPGSVQVALKLSESLKSLGYLSEAEGFLKEATKKWPKHADLAFYEAETLLALGKTDAALPALEIANSGSSVSMERLMLYAKTLLENKNPLLSGNATQDLVRLSKAQKVLLRALEINPGSFLCQLYLAEVLGAKEDLRTSFELFRKLMETNAARQEQIAWRINGGLGLVALKLNELETALAALQNAVALHPDHLMLQRYLADAYLAADLDTEALQTAKVALKLAPDDLVVLKWFADVSVQLGKQEEAVKALRCATQLSPDLPETWLRLANLEFEVGDFSAARHTLQVLCNLDCVSADHLHEAACIYSQLGDSRMALSCIERSLEQGSKSKEKLLLEAAYLNERLKKPEEALKLLQKVIGMVSEVSFLHVFQSDILSSLGRLDASLASLEHALRLIEDQNQTNGLNEAGLALVGASQQADQRVFPVEWATDLQDLASIHIRFARLLQHEGELVRALNHCEQALTICPESLSLRYFAADIAWALLQIEKAVSLADLSELFMEDDIQSFCSSADEQDKEAWIALNCLRAELAFEAGNEVLASQLIQAAIKIDPEHPRVMADQSILLGRWGDFETANEFFIRAMTRYQSDETNINSIQTMPSLNEYFNHWQFWISTAALELCQWEKAQQCMEEYLELYPKEPRAYLQLAKILIIQGERIRICDELHCVNHAPNKNILSQETHKKIDELFVQGGSVSNSSLIEQWKIRGNAVFEPAPETVRKLMENSISGIEIDGLVAALRWVGNTAGAIQIAEKSTNNAGVLLQKAICFVGEANEEGLAAAGKAIEARPNNPLCHAAYALIASNSGLWRETIQASESALSFWPDEPEWHALAAKAAWNFGDVDKAVLHWEQAFELNPKNAQFALSLGKAYLHKKAYSQAVDALNKSVQLNQRSAEGWYSLALAYQQTGNLMKGLDCADRACELDGQSTQPLLLSGEIALQLGKVDNALAYAKNALKRDCRDQESILFLVRILKEQKEPRKALRIIEKSLPEIEPTNQLLFEQAELVSTLEGAVSALPLITALENRAPEDFQVLNLLSKSQFSVGKLEEAEKTALRVLTLNPDHLETNLLLGKIKHQAGQLDQAVQYFSDAIRLSPIQVEPYIELAQIYEERREENLALQVYQKAIQVAPNDFRAFYKAGLILRERKEYVESETMLRRAAELSPDDINIRRQLGAVVALNLVHNSQEAKSYL